MNDPNGKFAFLIPIIVTAPTWVPWVVGGVLALGTAITLDAAGLNPFRYVKARYEDSKSKSDPDPYARPNQKKQGRERKEKKKEDNWTPNPNKKPKPLPKHSPGKSHRDPNIWGK